MPELKYDSLNINETPLVNKIVHTLSELSNSKSDFCKLIIQDSIYFHISGNQISQSAGWYIIVDNNGYPLYIGTAKNLNIRLNTQYGSRDNFANPTRPTDNTRNFIKKYRELRLISELFVILISEDEFRERLRINYQLEIDKPLTERDRANIEKILSIYRSSILYPILNRIKNFG